jgi:nucleobase:cation symporter-1, NCS1 family
MAVSGFLKKLEIKPTDDEYEAIETNRWGNRDIYPIPHDKRTYGVYAFVSYWGEFLKSTLLSIEQALT